jgi:hypothetical protein
MRRVPFIALFLYAAAAIALFFYASAYASAAHAGSLRFLNQSGALGTNNATSSYQSLGPSEALIKRPIGLDGLAFRLGISGKRLNFLEYTDGAGTNAESRLTVGVGSKGLLVRLVW